MQKFSPPSLFKVRPQFLDKYGEGVSVLKEAEIHVPYVLPEEEVEVISFAERGHKIYAKPTKILKESPDRTQAPCKHFALCGGCQLQHLKEEAYYTFKKDLLARPLKALGVASESLFDVVRLGPYQRRRADLKIKGHRDSLEIGFYEAQSHNLINIEMCLLLEPSLFALVEKFKLALAVLKKNYGLTRLQLTKSTTAFEAFLFAEQVLKKEDLTYLKEVGSKLNLGRFIWETPKERMQVLEQVSPQMQVGHIFVDLPPGSFVQATEKGEQLIRQEILTFFKGDGKVIDLYSGWGSYSLALIQEGIYVAAYEGSMESIAALHNALRKAGLSHKGRAEQRDLVRSPVESSILKQFDGIILNPPRNGAGPQIKEIIKSEALKILMVSCNPETFIRDTKSLLKGGYHLKKVRPIDQFYWTYHLETIACFEREKT